MKIWLKKISVPFIAMALPFFAAELFILFLVLNIANKLDDIPALLPLNLDFYS